MYQSHDFFIDRFRDTYQEKIAVMELEKKYLITQVSKNISTYKTINMRHLYFEWEL